MFLGVKVNRESNAIFSLRNHCAFIAWLLVFVRLGTLNSVSIKLVMKVILSDLYSFLKD